MSSKKESRILTLSKTTLRNLHAKVQSGLRAGEVVYGPKPTEVTSCMPKDV